MKSLAVLLSGVSSNFRPSRPIRLLGVLALAVSALWSVARASESAHEVWLIDQSNTYDSDGNGSLDSGGTLYIFDGNDVAGNAAKKATPQAIDLGGVMASWVRTQTGSAPVRPHYVTFNASSTHAIISFVGTGHVLILEAATRKPVFVVDVGAQAHAALPSPDETYILVANQNGKLVQRISTNYKSNTFALDTAATLDLATGVTPSGALKQAAGIRPDNAPIVALPDATSALAVVTLRGGGLFVLNARSTPMAIVAEYTIATVEPSGLFPIQVGNKFYFNSGDMGMGVMEHQSILYSLPVGAFSTTPNPLPNTPAPKVIFDHGAMGSVDSHGMILTKHDSYLWVADRSANSAIVVDPVTDHVVNEVEMAGALSSDPTPDLLAISPAGNRVYASLRGPNPLTGNNPEHHNAEGTTPGLGVIQVTHGGLAGKLKAVYRISHLDSAGIERADPHAIAVRKR
jgi:DNA-binding beta-propeller fold protein YncE